MKRFIATTRRKPFMASFAWFALGWALCATAGPAGVSAGNPSADVRFLDGLRSRGLYDLAERYCDEQLAREDLEPSRQAELTIELARTLAEQAAGAPADARQRLWQRALEVTEQFAGKHPNSAQLPLVRLQGALTLLARGELARREGQLTTAGAAPFEEAREALRAAIDRLGRLADAVEPMRREQSLRPQASPGLLSAHQLAALAKRIDYELARARRNQAESYPAGSADRANSLTEAVRLLTPLARLDPEDTMCWPSRIELVAAYRLLGETATARRILEAIAQQGPPAQVVLRARAERIRVALAEGQLAESLDVAAEGQDGTGTAAPQFDLARLEAYLAAWRDAAAQNDAAARKWQEQATTTARHIEQRHGPYWQHLAGMLLAEQVHSTADRLGNPGLMAEAADDLYRGGRVDDALAGYDRATALALERGDATAAFESGYKAAAIEHARDRHAEALRRFRDVALRSPGHTKAGAAHLMAVYHAAQIAREDNADALDKYAGLLAEHLEHWPAGATADEARLRLGQLHEHRGQSELATAAYRNVSMSYAEYPRVLDALAGCYRKWLGQLRAEGNPTAERAQAAARWFESLVLQNNGALPQTWTLAQRSAALAAAELRLTHTEDGFARAATLLRGALAEPGNASPEWISAAESLLVFALAGEGRRQEAAETLAGLSAGPPAQLLGTLDGLARATEQAAPEVRPELARLQLQTIDLLVARWRDLHAEQQRRVEQRRARALADAGQLPEALTAYARLARAHPDDAAVQEAYAALLAEQPDTGSQRLALAQWRTIEKRSPPDTEGWYRAKYEIARLHGQQGRKEQAAKMIELLELLHPEMGGPAMKARFQELRAQCRP